MYLKLIINCVLVIIFVKNVNSFLFSVKYNLQGNSVEKISSIEDFQFKVSDIPLDVQWGACNGTCLVDSVGLDLNCTVDYTISLNNHQPFLLVNLRDVQIINSSKWKCIFTVESRIQQKMPYNIQTAFELSIAANKSKNDKSLEKVQDSGQQPEIYAMIGVASVALLIIIVLIITTFYYKHKAANSKIWAYTSCDTPAKVGDKERDEPSNVRYTQMPIQSSIKSKKTEDRESCIYEALDNVRAGNTTDLPAPLPPPVMTIPRSTSTSHLTASDTPVSTLPKTGTLGDGKSTPYSKKKGMKSPEPREKNIVLLDRIKERPPLPLPSEEDYEEMSSPVTLPVAARKLPVTPEQFSPFQEKHELMNKSLKSPPKMMNKLGNPMLAPNPSELKHALEMRTRGLSGSQMLRPPGHGLTPTAGPSAAPSHSLKRAANDKLPRPPPPMKPKKLQPHSSPEQTRPVKDKPLPPPPASLPQRSMPIPVHTEHTDRDSDEEEWTYEPLSQYNFENHYSNY